jgi:hypothetical protein
MNMVTQFNEGDLVSFGNYLLSDARKQRFINHPEADKMPPLEDRLSMVHHADIANWIDMQSERKLLKKFNAICEESLSPEAMEMWEVIQGQLKSVRKNL